MGLDKEDAEPALKVPRKEGDPETVEQLSSAVGACEVVAAKDGSYDNIITPQGHYFINPGFDGTLSSLNLCTIPGAFKVGNAADATKQDSSNWLDFNLQSDTVTIIGRTSAPLTTPIPETPMQLRTFLSKLEACGKVRVKIISHTVTKK